MNVEFIETTQNNDGDNATLTAPDKAWQYSIDIDHNGRMLNGARRPCDPRTLEPVGEFVAIPSAILRWKQAAGEFTRSRYELLELGATAEVDRLMGPTVADSEVAALNEARAV